MINNIIELYFACYYRKLITNNNTEKFIYFYFIYIYYIY